ncbi:hypothetical protein [Spirosoma endophyticum]|uniref:Uncharacterized protein n=1 Tax=Spirosoma endophyticum TaxID=662367 RepID=A0A1I1UAC9_9BACT|nr:hypothetical protein [Spirosoma endophyticum]SFD67585.1 hypothetical protein SAMN05216167_106184 [Spirosoma endophyticum]
MNDRLKAANDGAYNNLLLIALAGIAIYLLVRGWSKSKQQTYLDAVGTDKNSQIALALRDAMNRSGIPLMMSIDGTDTALIMQQAALITDYKAVADAYRVLFSGSELTTDLTQELTREELIQFWAVVQKTGGTTTGGGSTSTGGTATPSLIGKTVTAKQTINIRIDKAPYDVESGFFGGNIQAKAGDYLGTYVSEMILPNIPYSGNRNTFVRYKSVTLGISEYHWVDKAGVKIG